MAHAICAATPHLHQPCRKILATSRIVIHRQRHTHTIKQHSQKSSGEHGYSIAAWHADVDTVTDEATHLRANDARATALGTGTCVKLIAATKAHGTPPTSCEVADDAGTAKKAADNAATAATGAGGTTTTPAAEDLLSHSSREVPLV